MDVAFGEEEAEDEFGSTQLELEAMATHLAVQERALNEELRRSRRDASASVLLPTSATSSISG